MIKPNTFFKIPKESNLYLRLEKSLKIYEKEHPDQLVFCISSILGIEDTSSYDGAIILTPNYKITFIGSTEEGFEDYIEDIIDDISSLSKKYNYQERIGRPREWKDKIISHYVFSKDKEIDIAKYISGEQNKVNPEDRRLAKCLISLCTGSINELNNEILNEPLNILDEVKNKIVLFDADQTRFLFNNYAIKRFVSVQGLSGTGKTELLLHKLRDIYSQNEKLDGAKIFFTCHNIALARELKSRVPEFFNKMKVMRQIIWEKELWVAHAWGSKKNPNSGLYTYICDYYNIPFNQYRYGVDYDYIFSEVNKYIDKIPKQDFKYCFDYVLIDESQDFPEIFFDVCKKITRQKVYTAGDVFQNIFYQAQNKPRGVDISLNRCYRTDPRTLMFAHTLGLGLKEKSKYNWFEKKDWENFGYKVDIDKKNQKLSLMRLPITRFEGNEPENSVVIQSGTDVGNICKIITQIKEEYPNIKPGDVSIIMIDDDKNIYQYMDSLAIKIREHIGWNVIRGHEDKHTDPDMLYLTNTNNVKGLEFPIAICITSKILDNSTYRNKIYTMLTRSFLITYLIIKDDSQVGWLTNIYKDISDKRAINDINIPPPDIVKQIHQDLISQSEERPISWNDFMDGIFTELGIKDESIRHKIKQSIISLKIDNFDKEKIKNYIIYTKNIM